MNKIKEYFSKNVVELRKNMKEYIGTYVITFIMTIALTIIYGNDRVKNDTFERVMVLYGLSVFVFFIVETITKKCLFRIIGYVVSLVVSGAVNVALYDYADKFFCMDRVAVGYLIISICVGLFVIIKKRKVNCYKYILDVFQNVFNYSIVYLLLNIGVTAITVIFIYLILGNEESDILVRNQILMFGLFYIPAMILAVSKEKAHITEFIKKIVKFLLYPLTVLAVVIIYIYMAKIIILKEVPSNEIFRIVATIFVVGFPILLMVKNYRKDSKFYDKSVVILPWLFIPLVVLQIYSLVLRCRDNGITVLRYVGWMMIVAELVIIVLTILEKKDRLEYSLLIIMIMTIIGTMTPFNAETMSAKNQLSIMKKIYNKDTKLEDLSEEQGIRLCSAYLYIKDAGEEYKKYLSDYTDNDEFKKITEKYGEMVYSIREDWDGERELELINIDFEDKSGKKHDIKKYKKLKYVDESDYGSSGEDKEYKEILEKMIDEYGKDLEKKLKKSPIISINDKKDIYVEWLYITYSDKDNKKSLYDYDIKGVMLYK